MRQMRDGAARVVRRRLLDLACLVATEETGAAVAAGPVRPSQGSSCSAPMSRVEANVQELKKAANSHRLHAHQPIRQNSARPPRSAVLLRFYGVESGMKAKYLTLKRLRSTAQIPAGLFGSNGHDLERGMRAIGVPAVIAGKPPALHRKTSGDDVPIARSHEALRYGVDLRRTDFDALDAWLVRLLKWLHNEGMA